MTAVNIEGKEIKLSNLNKTLWPMGITKGIYIEYLAKIGPYINKYLDDRPLVFTRYPDGINGKNFYEKNVPHYAPQWIKSQKIENTNYVIGGDLATLIWCGNRASIEIHPWHSTISRIDSPDYGIIDLDPMEKTDFEDCLEIAFKIKEILDGLGVKGYPKTSGSTGLQVYIPFDKGHSYQEVREVIEFFCTYIARIMPKQATVERMIKNREGKVYMDYLQMIKGKTIISPYCPRPKDNASVSAPITWNEVRRGVKARDFNIETMPDRLDGLGDIFLPVILGDQKMDKVIDFVSKNKKEMGLSNN